ncbi:hypothetical protein CDAR_317461 [Caerostris darwini]|uniref:Uncharacterized protein n=1 Tax=Caerostris darwini TaxID=1538125 RepID=A0AAV4QA67_9ARAC|nr:hypothetical protein CDAR_317461 [Caerostris darwini]
MQIDDPGCPGNVVEHWPWVFQAVKSQARMASGKCWYLAEKGLLMEIENRKSLDLFERDPNTKAGRRDRFLLMTVLSAYKQLAIEIDDPGCPGNVLEHWTWLILYRGWLAEIENRKALDIFERDPNTKAGRRDRFFLITVLSAYKHLAMEIDDPGCPGNVVEQWPWVFQTVKVRHEWHLENVGIRPKRAF